MGLQRGCLFLPLWDNGVHVGVGLCGVFALHAVEWLVATLRHRHGKKREQMHALFYYPLGFKVENYSFKYTYIRPDRNACLQLTGTAARWLSGLSTARCEFGSWNSSERNSSCSALWAAGPWCHQAPGKHSTGHAGVPLPGKEGRSFQPRQHA